jgi:hypothetical protein
MRKISCLASRHVALSRFLIIVLIYPLLNLAGWILGIWMNAAGMQLEEGGWSLFSIFFLILLISYPVNKKSFALRKVSDLLLALCSFGFMTMTGMTIGEERSTRTISSVHATSLEAKDPEPRKTVLKKKGFLKKFVEKISGIFKKSDTVGKILLVILILAAAVGLTYLLAALACSIACAGAEGLAYVVFFGGLIGIVVLTFHFIRKVARPKPTKNEIDKRIG